MKIVAMIPVYNEEDIISEVIDYLLSQEIKPVVLDNGSTDNSYEILKKFSERGVITLGQFKSRIFDFYQIFRVLYDMVLTQSPDWVVLQGADEFLESGMKNMKLNDSISVVDSNGYNLIQFNRFDFFLTDNDNESAKSIKQKLPYYSCQGDFLYRSWKCMPGIDIAYGGHYPIFPYGHKYKIYPRKFVLRHYIFRSKEQAEKKMVERMKRTNYNPRTKTGFNPHYNKVLGKEFLSEIDHQLLTKYEEDRKWNLEEKFSPFAWTNPPKKEDIFSDDGTLKMTEKTLSEYKKLLEEKESKMTIMILLRVAKKFTKLFSKR